MSEVLQYELSISEARSWRVIKEILARIMVFKLLVPYSKDLNNFHWHGIVLGELFLLGKKVISPPFGIIWPFI